MAATEKELGDLHAAVALALTEEVAGKEVSDEAGNKVVLRSAAMVGAAIAFLKNNNITADPSTNAAMRDLKDQLAARRKNKQLPQALLDEAANAFSASVGGMQIQ